MFTRHILQVLMLTISIPLAALAQQTNASVANAPTADAKAHAQEVLKQARAAIWNDASRRCSIPLRRSHTRSSWSTTRRAMEAPQRSGSGPTCG